MGPSQPFAASPTLLRHREHIPPFSSYGGILGAVLATAPFFRLLRQGFDDGRPGDVRCVNERQHPAPTLGEAPTELTEAAAKQYNHRLCKRFRMTEGPPK